MYAVWDRLVFPNERTHGKSPLNTSAFRGPTWFSRTANGGASWETARPILDPGQNDQTIGNQIVALGNGDPCQHHDGFNNDNRIFLAVPRTEFLCRNAIMATTTQ